MNTVSVQASTRSEFGKKSAKNIRKNGEVPGVIYSGNGEHVAITLSPKSLKTLIYTPEFKLAELDVDGKKHRCIIKEAQFHPVTEALEHVDFLKLIEGTPTKVELPIRFTGVSPGVRAGGKLQQTVRRVKVKATPESLVDHLNVDISTLELGQSVRVRDIELPEGIQVMTPEATPVAIIEIPRSLRSAAAAADKK